MATQPLRVFMTADTIGGVWSYAIELLRSLARYRCEFLLATLGSPLSPSQRRAAAQVANLTVVESTYQLEWMDDPWSDVEASSEWLLEVARDFRPDLVHLNTYTHGALPWQAPVLVVGHSCVLSWWQAVKGEVAPPTWAIYQQRVHKGLANANMVVAPTQAMMNELITYYGPFRASQVIYNARCTADFVPGMKENFIFTMGRVWDEAKNIAILDQIAQKVPWPIYVAGEAQHPSGRKVQLHNLHTLGHLSQSDIRAWLARASIFVLPARYEPFGLAVLEAALSGCALLLGDIPSLRELWNDAALYTPPDDALMLRQCLTQLIGSETQRGHLAEAARTRAARYSSDRMAHGYWRLYQSVIAQARTSGKQNKVNTEFYRPISRGWRSWSENISGNGVK